jgi:hypothetical protein
MAFGAFGDFGPGVPDPRADPQMLGLMRTALARQQMQPDSPMVWPDNPAMTPTRPMLQPPAGPGGGPMFWQGSQPPGAGPGEGRFGDWDQQSSFPAVPTPPPPDLYAAGRYHMNRKPAVMDESRSAALQEMGKYLQAYGKLHQQHSSLQQALHGMNRPKGL